MDLMIAIPQSMSRLTGLHDYTLSNGLVTIESLVKCQVCPDLNPYTFSVDLV